MSASLKTLSRGLLVRRNSLEELRLLNTGEARVVDVTFLLLSGLRVFRGTMRRPLAKALLETLALGKHSNAFGSLEEVEVELFGQEVFNSGACTGGLNPLEDELVDSAGIRANLRRLKVSIGGAGGHVYHEKVWQDVKKLLHTFCRFFPWQQLISVFRGLPGPWGTRCCHYFNPKSTKILMK